MSENTIYPVPEKFAAASWINQDAYHELYQKSLDNPEEFWAQQAETLYWHQPFSKVTESYFYSQSVQNQWFSEGKLNACFNCVDRHLPRKSDQLAILWQGENDQDVRKITYQELYNDTCRIANVLLKAGVQKGDRVVIHMPMVPEAIYAMLACARIGAIHSFVFGGFAAGSLATRIEDCKAKIILTLDEGHRRGQKVPFKKNTDEALKQIRNGDVETVIVFPYMNRDVPMQDGRDYWYDRLAEGIKAECDLLPMESEDPLFILYTSGSTGKPKGLLHTTGGYLVYAATTFKYIFDYKDGEMYWCTADIGWITGHTYGVYGPLLNGATILLHESVPDYPTPSRVWDDIDKHQVNIFYTAPTALRALRRHGDHHLSSSHRSSLRLLGSVGEPLDPETWEWYYKSVGAEACPIVDTWWQTETGGIMLTTLPGAMSGKPGYVGYPFFGVEPELVTDTGDICPPETTGHLILKRPWPGIARTIYGDHDRYLKTYFSRYPGFYSTSDEAVQDAEGRFRILGRSDDVLQISGHLIGVGEVEAVLMGCPKIAEVAVVGFSHALTGQGAYVFAVLKEGFEGTEAIKEELIYLLRQQYGPIIKINFLQWATGLPKTRSGKVMRRILRKIADNRCDDLGDVSTLANPESVSDLVRYRKNLEPAQN